MLHSSVKLFSRSLCPSVCLQKLFVTAAESVLMIELFLVLKVAQKLTYTERESEGGGVVRQQTDTRCFREKIQPVSKHSRGNICSTVARSMCVITLAGACPYLGWPDSESSASW